MGSVSYGVPCIPSNHRPRVTAVAACLTAAVFFFVAAPSRADADMNFPQKGPLP